PSRRCGWACTRSPSPTRCRRPSPTCSSMSRCPRCNENDMNWLAVLPEIVLLAMACVVAMGDLWVPDERRTPTYVLTQLTLAAVAFIHLVLFNEGQTFYAMQRMVVADPMGHLLAFFAAIAMIVTLAYARP